MESRDETAKRVGDNIRRLLALHLISLAEGAKQFGITPQALSEIQLGRRVPRTTTLQRIAEFFEVPIDALLRLDFAQLLSEHLADEERFRRVEAKLAGPKTARRTRAA